MRDVNICTLRKMYKAILNAIECSLLTRHFVLCTLHTTKPHKQSTLQAGDPCELKKKTILNEIRGSLQREVVGYTI